MKHTQSVIIAIAGASGSGKSLLSNTICKEMCEEIGSEQVAVITEDCYYRDQSHKTMAEREKTNYDHPESMDHELLLQDLQRLRRGEGVDVPVYSYTEHTRANETTYVEPKRVIILEGILLLTDPKLRELFHASIFMDTPLDICLIRRLSRDVQERGRTMDSVLKQYQDTVRPMFQQFIEPSKQYSDVIVPKGGKNRIAINMLKAKIHQLLGATGA